MLIYHCVGFQNHRNCSQCRESIVLIILESHWGTSVHLLERVLIRITLLFGEVGFSNGRVEVGTGRDGAGIEIWRKFSILEPVWISIRWTCYFSMQVCLVYSSFIGKLTLECLNTNNSSHCRFNQEIMNCVLTYILSKCGLIVRIVNLINDFQ